MFHESLSSEIFFQHKTRGLREAKKCAWNNSTGFICMLIVKVRQKSAPIRPEKVRQNVDGLTESAPPSDFFRHNANRPSDRKKSAKQKCATRSCHRLVRRGSCRACTRRRWEQANRERVNAWVRQRRARQPRTWPCLDCGTLGASLRCKPCAARRTAYVCLVVGPRDSRGRRIKR